MQFMNYYQEQHQTFDSKYDNKLSRQAVNDLVKIDSNESNS